MARSTEQQRAAGTYTGAGQEIAAVGRTILDACNAPSFDRLDGVVPPEAEYRDVATGEGFRGADGMKRYQRNRATAFPESRVELRDPVACGERCARGDGGASRTAAAKRIGAATWSDCAVLAG